VALAELSVVTAALEDELLADSDRTLLDDTDGTTLLEANDEGLTIMLVGVVEVLLVVPPYTGGIEVAEVGVVTPAMTDELLAEIDCTLLEVATVELVADEDCTLLGRAIVELVADEDCTLLGRAIVELESVLDVGLLMPPGDRVDAPAEEVLVKPGVEIDTEAPVDTETLLVVNVELPREGEMDDWLVADVESG